MVNIKLGLFVGPSTQQVRIAPCSCLACQAGVEKLAPPGYKNGVLTEYYRYWDSSQLGMEKMPFSLSSLSRALAHRHSVWLHFHLPAMSIVPGLAKWQVTTYPVVAKHDCVGGG